MPTPPLRPEFEEQVRRGSVTESAGALTDGSRSRIPTW